MVFSYAFCALNLASTLLANGICCVYQMKKDEERKQEQEAILRETIHARWERHRLEEISEQQRRGRDRHATKDEAKEDDEEKRRIRFVDEVNSQDFTVVHQNLRARSIQTTVDERQSPTYMVMDKHLCSTLSRDPCVGENPGPSDQQTRLLGSQPNGRQIRDANLFRGHLSKVVSLMDESDDEDRHLEEVCIE
jgi:hypothetical protein